MIDRSKCHTNFNSDIFQFHFSTRFDIIILTIGLLSAIGEGAIAPFMLLLISSIIETFSGQRIDHCKFNVTISNMQDCGLNNSLISTNDSAEMMYRTIIFIKSQHIYRIF